jgi:SAM-dependent methyltransferase
MTIRAAVKKALPNFIAKYFSEISSGPSRARKESNEWLRDHCRDIQGKVLSIGSGNDADGEGDYYRNYYPLASSYTTSEVSDEFDCDLTLDVRSMAEIEDATYDCIFCSGVLEHVDDYKAALDELARILKTGGILLLGIPFRQAIHMDRQDFWRFTIYGIQYLLKDLYEIIDITPIDSKKLMDFPAAYWVHANKKRRV